MIKKSQQALLNEKISRATRSLPDLSGMPMMQTHAPFAFHDCTATAAFQHKQTPIVQKPLTQRLHDNHCCKQRRIKPSGIDASKNQASPNGIQVACIKVTMQQLLDWQAQASLLSSAGESIP